jgi:hypothetical protein
LYKIQGFKQFLKDEAVSKPTGLWNKSGAWGG